MVGQSICSLLWSVSQLICLLRWSVGQSNCSLWWSIDRFVHFDGYSINLFALMVGRLICLLWWPVNQFVCFDGCLVNRFVCFDGCLVGWSICLLWWWLSWSVDWIVCWSICWPMNAETDWPKNGLKSRVALEYKQKRNIFPFFPLNSLLSMSHYIANFLAISLQCSWWWILLNFFSLKVQ